jgi:hypothetical protein
MDTWVGMIARCENKNHISYSRYGGRGIYVCERWKSSFENFVFDMGNKPNGMSLDRINNDGEYSKENCRWATSKEQADNRSTTRLITIGGITDSLSGWAKRKGISAPALSYRINKLGISVETALSIPASRSHRNKVNWNSIK